MLDVMVSLALAAAINFEAPLCDEVMEAAVQAQVEEDTAKREAESARVVYSADDLRYSGVIYGNGCTYTWYSESELPGGDLYIPGRHHELGFVMDGEGNVCVASCDYARGTAIEVPFGYGRAIVYDYCPTSGIVDVYLP